MLTASLLATILLQDPELEQAIKIERQRIAAKKPLTPEEANGYASMPGRPSGKARKSYRVAVVPLEFSDTRYDGTGIGESLKRLADYYRGLSGGAFELAMDVRPVVSLDLEREAFGKLETGSRDEKKTVGPAASALEGVDGLIFFAAGGIGARGTALWPHKDVLELSSRTLDYLIIPCEAGTRRDGILAHEFGHLLGLEDKYEDRAAKVDRWCLMGTGYLGDDQGKPMPLCGVCRERLGWAAVPTLEAGAVGKIRLGPGELARIPLAEGKEALVLEMREKLLVWHTGGGKPIELAAILPSEAGDRLTPWSDPPFLARTLGSRTVWLTDVRAQDGCAYLRAGFEAELTALEELRRSRIGRPLGK